MSHAEQCPTCRTWTDDAAGCTHGYTPLARDEAFRYATARTPWLRALLANLAIAGGLQLAWETGWDVCDWGGTRSPRFR